jgi:hypothetical protein
MKTTKITKDQAISIIGNILRERCAIPMASIGNGESRKSYLGIVVMEKDILWCVSKLKDKAFRVVPTSEISNELLDNDLDYYDVCVEFTNNDGDYSEQFLLWNIESFKD